MNRLLIWNILKTCCSLVSRREGAILGMFLMEMSSAGGLREQMMMKVMMMTMMMMMMMMMMSKRFWKDDEKNDGNDVTDGASDDGDEDVDFGVSDGNVISKWLLGA